MDRAEFITVEQSRTDLILSFAIAPSAERSLVLLRSPPYELLLPEEERGISISKVPRDHDVDRNLLLSVLWEATRVELHSQLCTCVVDVSMVDKGGFRGPKAPSKDGQGRSSRCQNRLDSGSYACVSPSESSSSKASIERTTSSRLCLPSAAACRTLGGVAYRGLS